MKGMTPIKIPRDLGFDMLGARMIQSKSAVLLFQTAASSVDVFKLEILSSGRPSV